MTLREELVTVALKWQEQFGVVPHVTSAVAEYDAAEPVGMLEDYYDESDIDLLVVLNDNKVDKSLP